MSMSCYALILFFKGINCILKAYWLLIGLLKNISLKDVWIGTFRFDYEYDIKYEYDFGISTQSYPPSYNSFLLLTNT